MIANVGFKEPSGALHLLQGLITAQGLYESYHTLLRLQHTRCIQYLMVDGSEMIYQLELFMRPEIIALNRQVVTHPNLTHVVIVATTHHPLHMLTQRVYKEWGVFSKIHYAPNPAEGWLWIERGGASLATTQ